MKVTINELKTFLSWVKSEDLPSTNETKYMAMLKPPASMYPIMYT